MIVRQQQRDVAPVAAPTTSTGPTPSVRDAAVSSAIRGTRTAGRRPGCDRGRPGRCRRRSRRREVRPLRRNGPPKSCSAAVQEDDRRPVALDLDPDFGAVHVDEPGPSSPARRRAGRRRGAHQDDRQANHGEAWRMSARRRRSDHRSPAATQPSMRRRPRRAAPRRPPALAAPTRRPTPPARSPRRSSAPRRAGSRRTPRCAIRCRSAGRTRAARRCRRSPCRSRRRSRSPARGSRAGTSR